LPILGVLHRGEQLSGWAGGAKFVTLCHALDVNQAAVRQSLDHLIELGLVDRNSGYGHPLRPEYILTRRGDRLAPMCAAIDTLLARLDVRDFALRRWSMPVVSTIDRLRSARFNALALRIDGITDRALSLSLAGLCAVDLVDRGQSRGPGQATAAATTAYELSIRARPLATLLAAI